MLRRVVGRFVRVLLVGAPVVLAPAARPQSPQPAAPAGTAAAAEDAAARALDAWEARVKQLKSFTCRFRQEKKLSFMRRPLVSSGRIAYRDRRLLWRTEEPAPGFLSVSEAEVRIYTPEWNTLEIVPLGKGGARGGAAGTRSSSALSGAFPGFTGDFSGLRETYVVELLPPAGANSLPKPDATETRLRFTPRADELKQEVVAIEVALDERLDVRAWRIVRADGDELALTISDFAANAPVSDAELTFDVPADAKVTRLPGGAP